MSGFDAAWLALREAADRRARSPRLVTQLREALTGRAGHAPLRIADLGCGSGSTLRALAHELPRPQRWICVDDSPPLLALCARESGEGIAVECIRADLDDALEGSLPANIDVIAASALLDLVSHDWMTRLIDLAEARGALLYVALSYDGRFDALPPHPDDGAIREAFNAHQRRDKGFGPALGPLAAQSLDDRLQERGWRVAVERSDWGLDARGDERLLAELVDGVAAAAVEQEPSSGAAFAAWHAARRAQVVAGALALTVGHRDVLARPPGQ